MAEVPSELIAALSKLTGESPKELQQRLDKIRLDRQYRAMCRLHEFELITKEKAPGPGKYYQCKNCRYVAKSDDVQLYEQGLRHGRENPKGGGVV